MRLIELQVPLAKNKDTMDTDSETLLVQAWLLRELDSEQSIALLDSIELVGEDRAAVCAKINVVRSFHFSSVYNFWKTLDACTEALEVLINSDEPLWLARLYGRLAVGFHSLGDISNAYRNFQLQIDMAYRCEPEQQREEFFYAYHNMGRHFFKLGDNERADQNYKKAYSYTSPGEYLYGYLQVNHAQCLIKQDKLEEATALVNSALEAGCRLNITRIRHYALPVLANLAAISNNPQEAERLYLEAVSFASDNNLPVYDVYLHLAELYLASDNLNQAKAIIEIAAETSRGSGDEIHAMRVDEIKCKIYESLGNYKLALAHHKAFHESQKTLFFTEKNNKKHGEGVAQRIEFLEKKYAKLESHNQDLQQRVLRISDLKDRAEKNSKTDILTELFNRRHLKSEAPFILVAAAEKKQYVSVSMLDIDSFKQVNDQWGHQTGDAVLRQLALIMTGCMRDNDLVVRYGGDEFVIVMSDTNHESAMAALQRLREMIKAFDWQGLQAGLSVTVSAGIACELAPSDLDELYKLADKRLYEAKKMGRDRVVGESLECAD